MSVLWFCLYAKWKQMEGWIYVGGGGDARVWKKVEILKAKWIWNWEV